MEYPQRKLHRLKCWDYSQNGYYHVTICTQKKRKLLCSIRQNGLDVQVVPTAIGEIVAQNWQQLGTLYPNVKTDFFCLMPNHVHGILVIEEAAPDHPVDLAKIVRGFKSVTTRAYNKTVPDMQKNTLWQASYYDEIIRNDVMLQSVRNYIIGNPSKWMEDDLYID